MYLSDPANAGHKDKCWCLLMEGSHFVAAPGVQSGHSPHALPHQLPKGWGTRTEGQGVALKSGEQSYLSDNYLSKISIRIILFLKVCCWGSIVQLCPTCKFSYGKVTVGSFTCSMSPVSIVLPVLQGQLRSLAGNLAPERNSSGKQPFQKHIIKPSDQ